MTGFQAFTTGTVALRDLDPYRFPSALVDDLPEQTPTARGVEPADRRRLELHAALTTAGIAPLPGDMDAIEALCVGVHVNVPTRVRMKRDSC